MATRHHYYMVWWTLWCHRVLYKVLSINIELCGTKGFTKTIFYNQFCLQIYRLVFLRIFYRSVLLQIFYRLVFLQIFYWSILPTNLPISFITNILPISYSTNILPINFAYKFTDCPSVYSSVRKFEFLLLFIRSWLFRPIGYHHYPICKPFATELYTQIYLYIDTCGRGFANLELVLI